MDRENVSIYMNTAVTPEQISLENPDAAIIAIGAEQIIPGISGIENAMMAFDVFGHEELVKGNVVIIGGGDIGCELSIHLSELGHKVTIVEMTHFLAANSELTVRMALLQEMEEKNVTSYMDTLAKEIHKDGVVICDKEGKESFIPSETIIISVGTKPLVKERDEFADVAFDVIYVGDCKKASNVQHAVETGFDAGYIL